MKEHVVQKDKVAISPRISVSEYENFFKNNYKQVFDTLKTPYACTKDYALRVAYEARSEFTDLLSSTHKRKIPMLVAYMKLKGFLTTIRKKLFNESQGTLGDAVIKYKYIGFSGNMGSGKTLSATMLQRELDVRMINSIRCSFAEPVKKILIDYFNFTYDDLYTQEGKLRHNAFWGMTNRNCLQKFGTDAIRNGFHPDAWVKLAELKTKKFNSLCIFDDVRFVNETNFIKSKGIVIKIENPRVKSTSNHASEQINDCYDELIINDGAKEDLRKKVIAIADKYGLIGMK